MSASDTWYLSGSPQSKALGISGTSPNPNPGAKGVLRGRVTKPTHPRVTPRIEKFKNHIQSSEDSDNGVKSVNLGFPLDLATPDTRERESDGEEYDHGQGEREEEDDDDKSDSEDGNQEDSTIGTRLAMMIHRATYENDIEDDADSGSDLNRAWRWEQVYLNKILNARNQFTLMPSTWRMHFRGIPLPDSLFYIKTKSKSIRPKIYARTDRLEYRGALALRKLMDVHARIQDIRDDEAAVKDNDEVDRAEKKALIKNMSIDMAKQLRRALEQSLDWAKQDGGIEKYGGQLLPNVRVMELESTTATDEPESEVRIQTEMCSLAEEWRTHASNGCPSVQSPVIFGFVIMKHIITIVTLDTLDPCAAIHVPCRLHMAERNQHQWNALAILVTICWARDMLLDYIDAQPDLQPEVKAESSDPDA
ncbi:hypothetical protein SAMD00023353_0101030 [Rosellinia necatrix]|uniref:Uncharacterized protein n=1 Tax=Rosellinia necatrix TaxID=77044 RepID=A0A1S7UHD6_ROSNE|nr:hypothetical protein SAMD00023353_0101030 [Rosellinia necatrix]